MVDYRTEPKVREIAIEFRKKHDALEWGVDVDDLIKLKGFAQDVYPTHQPFSTRNWKDLLETASSFAKKVVTKVKALVSLKEEVILVAGDLPSRQKPFAKAHELGHIVLPWHEKILYACDEHDLSPGARDQLEFEANTFASEVIYPRDLLLPYYENFPTSLETVMLIQKRSGGASIHAAAHAYVRHHPGVCGLMTLEDIKLDPTVEPTNKTPILRLIRKSLSRSAVRSALGKLTKDQTFPIGHVVYQRSRGTNIETADMHIGERTENNLYTATLLNNGYKVFCLMVEKKS